MLSFKSSCSILSSFPLTFSSPKLHSSRSTLRVMASSSKVEHIVLFKTKPQSDPSKVNEMVSSLKALVSLPHVLHLTASPLHKLDSSPFEFTHILHSQYSSKESLAEYNDHPQHVAVVADHVRPMCDDAMAVDWVSSPASPAPQPGSAVRVTFLKLKEGVGEKEKNEVFEALKGIKARFKEIESLSYGENFSERVKGYQIASLAVYKGLEDLKNAVEKEKEVNEMKDKVREHLESVIVVDFEVPGSASD